MISLPRGNSIPSDNLLRLFGRHRDWNPKPVRRDRLADPRGMDELSLSSALLLSFSGMCMCVCVLFSSYLFWTSSSLDVPAGVTQEEGHTRFLIRLPSAVLAWIFLARKIQPFLSLVDHEVEFCVLILIFLWGKIWIRVTASRFELTSQRQKLSRLPTEPPGRPVLLCVTVPFFLSFFLVFSLVFLSFF